VSTGQHAKGTRQSTMSIVADGFEGTLISHDDCGGHETNGIQQGEGHHECACQKPWPLLLVGLYDPGILLSSAN